MKRKIEKIKIKEGFLYLSIFILMFLLSGVPLFFPKKLIFSLIESELLMPVLFLLEFVIIVPFYMLFIRKKIGFGTFRIKEFAPFSFIILFIQLFVPVCLMKKQFHIIEYEYSSSLVIYIFIQVSYILLAPVYEEIAVRGGLYGALCIFLKAKTPAAILSSLIFSLLHTQYSGYKPFITLFFVGLALTAARIRSQGLMLPIILHITMNFFVSNVDLS